MNADRRLKRSARRPWFLLAALAVSACRREHSAPQPIPSDTAKLHAASADAAAPSPLLASAGAPSALLPAAGEAEFAAASVHCKALGKKGLTSIGPQREELVDMVARDASVYLLSYHQGLARATLTRQPRDGSAATVVARHTGSGEPKGFVLTDDAGYFTRNRGLIRMALAGGQAVVAAKEFSTKIAAFGGFLYGVRCAKKGQADHLVRVSDRGRGTRRTRGYRASCA